LAFFVIFTGRRRLALAAYRGQPTLFLAVFVLFELEPIPILLIPIGSVSRVIHHARFVPSTILLGGRFVVVRAVVIQAIPQSVKLLEFLVPVVMSPVIQSTIFVHVLAATEAAIKIARVVIFWDAEGFLGISIH
jgi:hypothetical protein